MDITEYRKRGKEMVDYIADYLENIRDRRVFPDVKPGYMQNLLPDSAPIEGENWDRIFSDVERVIMPGITHWQSPHMHAYFPALNSFPSLLGDMLADAINCLGFTWASSPACTELEIIVMNWLGKMINLPDDFLHLNSSSRGGGVVQTTASEATLVCLLAGRTRAIQRYHEKRPGYQDAEINASLVAYCSDQAHSSVEKAALIGLVRMRYIEADENLSMRGKLLREAIEDDISKGLVPFWVCATLGTTGSCSFDNLEEIGSVCREFNLWLHVDAAYAGSAFICPEFRTWLAGIEKADSIAFNPSKWLMIHFDATALWVKDSTAVHRTFNVEPLYLQHENSGVAVDFMHWQIPLSRRFRALKIWFVLRSYGIKGLQRHIREGVRLAQKFEALVLADHRFEIPAKRHLGLVVFRIKGENEITERLLKRLNHRGNLHCIPSSLKGKYVIRFTVTSTRTTVDDILRDWMEIKTSATTILDEMNISISNRLYLKDIKEKCEGFGSSLLLSNSPLSPKIINGSFAALFDADEFLAATLAGIRIAHQESSSMRRRVRGILMSGKRFSLDSHMDVVVQTSMDSNTTNSSMINCYGKTSDGKTKTKERDSIYEVEESLEALQMNSTNYLAVFNTHQLIPIDNIHPPHNLSSLSSKYYNRYEVNNYTTRSVNSVRTPLTQYQLYRLPNYYYHKEITQEKSCETSNLYPGKRFLNLDLPLHNVSSFTDTIYNLPTPTEDIIPIIITEGTPTTTSSKSIDEIDDLNKLKPPALATVIENVKTSNVKPIKKPEIPKKPAILTASYVAPLTKTTATAATKTDFTFKETKINTLKPIPENVGSKTSNLVLTSCPSLLDKTTNIETVLNETSAATMDATIETKSTLSNFKNKTLTTALATSTKTTNIISHKASNDVVSANTTKTYSVFEETASNISNTDLVSDKTITIPLTTATNTQTNTVLNETAPKAINALEITDTISNNIKTASLAATANLNRASKDVVLTNFNETTAKFSNSSSNTYSVTSKTTTTSLTATKISSTALKETVSTNTTLLNAAEANILNTDTATPLTTTINFDAIAKEAVLNTTTPILNETTTTVCKPNATSSSSSSTLKVLHKTTTTPLTTTTNADSFSSESTSTSTVLDRRLNSTLNTKFIKNNASIEDLMSSSSSLSDEFLESVRQPSSDSENSSAATLSIELI